MGRGAHTSWPISRGPTHSETPNMNTPRPRFTLPLTGEWSVKTEIISKIRLNMINKCSLMLAQACKYGLWRWADLWSYQSAKVQQCPWKSNNNWQGNKWRDRVTYSHNIRLQCENYSLPLDAFEHYMNKTTWKLEYGQVMTLWREWWHVATGKSINCLAYTVGK